MRPVLPLSLLLIALAGPPVAAAELSHSGFYTNLRYIAEADDYVGIRLEVRQGSQSTVEFELCEGWCNGAETFPAVISGDRISFTYLQRSTDQAEHETFVQVPVTGHFKRRSVMLKVGDEPAERLKLQRRKP